MMQGTAISMSTKLAHRVSGCIVAPSSLQPHFLSLPIPPWLRRFYTRRSFQLLYFLEYVVNRGFDN
jgi:hypothetical protein